MATGGRQERSNSRRERAELPLPAVAGVQDGPAVHGPASTAARHTQHPRPTATPIFHVHFLALHSSSRTPPTRDPSCCYMFLTRVSDAPARITYFVQSNRLLNCGPQTPGRLTVDSLRLSVRFTRGMHLPQSATLPRCYPYQDTPIWVAGWVTSSPKTTAATAATATATAMETVRSSSPVTQLGPDRVGQGITMPSTSTIVPWSGCSLGPHGPKLLVPGSPGYPDSCSSSLLSHRCSEPSVSLPCAIVR